MAVCRAPLRLFGLGGAIGCAFLAGLLLVGRPGCGGGTAASMSLAHPFGRVWGRDLLHDVEVRLRRGRQSVWAEYRDAEARM